MSELKSVLIVPSNTDLNRGDQSLTWESINIIESIFGKQNVRIYLYKKSGKPGDISNVNKQTEKLNYSFLTRILAHPNRSNKTNQFKFSKLTLLKWGVIALFDLTTTLLLLSRFRLFNKAALVLLNQSQKEAYRIFEKIDYLFVKGGGFLHSYGSIVDPYIMYFQLFDVLLAHKMKKKVFVFPNSIGPIKNSLAKYLVNYALSKCTVVTVREGVSANYLQTNAIPYNISPDLGFYLHPSKKDFNSYLYNKGIDTAHKKNIAVTLRPYRFDGKQKSTELYDSYLAQMEAVVESLLSQGLGVTLLVHTYGPSTHEDDRMPLQNIYNKLHKKHSQLVYLHDETFDCTQIEKVYSYFDLVIGTRFHSVIFALNVNTPAIAIAYGGNKAYGIMQDMGLEKYVVPIENPDSEIILNLANQILIMPEKYLKKVFLYKQLLIEERKKLVELIKNSVEV